MRRLAFDMVSACASVLATMKSTPCSPAAIMLLTALPPAPPTPNTIMRAFISRISVMSVIFASRLLRRIATYKPCRHLLGCHSLSRRLQQLNRQAIGALALALEICSVIGCPCFEPHDLRLQCLKPCRRLLGRRSFGSRLKQLNRQAIGALALALEICSVIGCRCFEPRDLRRQCLNLCRRLLG